MLAGSEVTLPVEPFISVGGLVLCAIITGCFTVLGIWLSAKFRRVEQQTAPTGNGYARRTEESLDRLERGMYAIAGDLRDTNHRVDRLADRFNDHISIKEATK